MENITRTQTAVTKQAPVVGSASERSAHKLMLQDLMARADGSYEAHVAANSVEVPAEHIEFEGTVADIAAGHGLPKVTITAGGESVTLAVSDRTLALNNVTVGARVRGSYNLVDGDRLPSSLEIEVI